MTVIARHWLVHDRQGNRWIKDDEEVIGYYRGCGYTVEGPFVLEAEQPQGAVEALRKIDALLDEDITAAAFRLRCESLVPDALSLFGGQS